MIHFDNRLGALEPEYKKTFARFLWDGLDAFTAALRMWSSDGQFAYYISEKWVRDPFVIMELDKLRTTARREVEVPTKQELAKEIYDRAKLWNDADMKLKGYRLVAEMLGYLEKAAPNTNVTNNTNVIGKVMIVKDHGENDDWEKKLQIQQQKLIEHA